MSGRAVHWSDGMFLRAQHFQAAERSTAHSQFRRHSWSTHFCWGVREVDIDADALGNNKFVVRRLKACFRDGTTVAVPDDGVLSALDLRGSFQRASSLTVYLAVPTLDLSKPNAAQRLGGGPVRFLTDVQPVADENTGDADEQITFRSLNFRLLLSTDDHAGYDVLPITRLTQSGLQAGGPEIDPMYYPPLLAVDGWPAFTHVLGAVYEQVSRKSERLAAQFLARGGRGGPADWAADAASLLRSLNEISAGLGVLAFAPGVSPLDAYTELCRAVGRLAFFGADRTVPELPQYDHEDLGPRVARVKELLDALLGRVIEPEYKERRFVGAGLHLEAELGRAWVGPDWQLYVGARGSLPEPDLRALLVDGARFGLKLGSGPRVDELYRLGAPGLTVTPATRSPELPGGPWRGAAGGCP